MGLGGRDGATKAAPQVYTMKDVAKHNTPSDAWVVINGNVYDVSNWSGHPGGSIVFTHAGYDGTDTFGVFHPAAAYAHLEPYLIGTVSKESVAENLSPFEADYRKLKAAIRTAGLHKASSLYYAWKIVSNLMILGAAVLLVLSSSSFAVHMLSALLVGLFWQQCGWLSHDFLHHQVFRNRFFGDLMGYFVGNLSQGFSVSWWKNKHNTHHAIPNLLCENELNNGDPDINTAPFLAWAESVGRLMHMEGGMGRFCVKYQAFLYFPILFLARISWLIQSFQYVFFPLASNWGKTFDKLEPKTLPNHMIEYISILGYYGWNLWLLSCMPFLHALAFIFVSQCMCGLFLAIAFGVGHNGMSVYPYAARPGFGELQVTTTRNVDGSWLVGWFMGGLHLQVEHHLYPFVPRHNLHKVRELVEPLCKRHGIPYHSTSLWVGTVEVLQHLQSVSVEVLKEFPAM